MSKGQKVLISIVAIYLTLVILPAGYVYLFNGGPWQGTILDNVKKQPIKDVVVLAIWESDIISPGGVVSGYHHSYETITNDKGFFQIPSYVPISFFPILVSKRGPFFSVYKPGFLYEHNKASDTFQGNKRSLYLKRLNSKEERLTQIANLPPSMPDEKMPNLIRLMNQEEIVLGLKPTHTKGTSK